MASDPSDSPLLGSGTGDDGGGGGFELPAALKEFAENPKGFILTIVAAWIVGGILFVGRVFVDAILQLGDILLIVPETFRDVVVATGGAIAAPIVGFVGDLNTALVELGHSLGPFGAIVLPVLYLALGIALARLAAWLVDVVDVPGVDLGAVLRGVTAVPRAIWGVFRG